MMQTRPPMPYLAVLCFSLLCTASLLTGLAEASDAEVINLHPIGPQPSTLTVTAGTAVIWVSHFSENKLEVVTVAFHAGPHVAQMTTLVQGHNGFMLEGGHFIGRMEGNGGKVALRFTTPGTYPYAIGHHEYLTGTIVVQP